MLATAASAEVKDEHQRTQGEQKENGAEWEEWEKRKEFYCGIDDLLFTKSVDVQDAHLFDYGTLA